MKKGFKRMLGLGLAAVCAFGLSACGGGGQSASTTAAQSGEAKSEAGESKSEAAGTETKKEFVIGMSQCNLGEPWRVAMNDQIKMAAEKHPEFKVIYADAAQDNSKQIADIQNFIQQKVDLIITSPNEATPLTM